MGYYTSTRARGIKYLTTTGNKPYCAYPHISEVSINSDNVKTAGDLILILKYGSGNGSLLLTKYEFMKFYLLFYTFFLYRQADELLPSNQYKTLSLAQNDIGLSENFFLQFIKKPKPLFGVDPYAPQVIFDKIKITNYETNEMYF